MVRESVKVKGRQAFKKVKAYANTVKAATAATRKLPAELGHRVKQYSGHLPSAVTRYRSSPAQKKATQELAKRKADPLNPRGFHYTIPHVGRVPAAVHTFRHQAAHNGLKRQIRRRDKAKIEAQDKARRRDHRIPKPFTFS
jgi:hypothetical protein